MTNTPPMEFDYHNDNSDEKFLFISYSHKDKSAVYKDLHSFYQLGINYWYDKALDPGDKWNERVKNIINHPRCCGVVFFVSANTCKSQAVHEEILIVEEIQEKNPKFSIFTVHFQNESIMEIAYRALKELKEENENLDSYHCRFKKILNFLTNTIIYLVHGNPYHEELQTKLIAKEPKVVSTKTSHIKQLLSSNHNFTSHNNQYILKSFGKHMQDEVPKPPGIFNPKGIVIHNGSNLFGLNRSTFSFGKLDWWMHDYDNGIFTFISTSVIDVADCKDINQVLSDFFEIAFTPDCKDILIERPRLLQENQRVNYQRQFIKARQTDYVKSKANQLLAGIWVQSDNQINLVSNDFIPLNITNSSAYKGGVIIVIKLNAEKLIKYGGKQ